MQGLLRELPIHHSLARVFSRLGTPLFWRSLVDTLRLLTPLDNALVTLMAPGHPPQGLEDFEFNPAADTEQLADYFSGMYLLDPFYLAARHGMADGLYRLQEVAPDQFWQSEYYLSYFSQVVGQDEVQFIVNLDEGRVLELSLGSRSALLDEQFGVLLAVRDWVLAAMRKHLSLVQLEVPLSSPVGNEFATILGRFATRLSERESVTARLILQGFSSKAIAKQLGISPETVKVHRRNLYHKLGVTTHAELFALFLQQGDG